MWYSPHFQSANAFSAPNLTTTTPLWSPSECLSDNHHVTYNLSSGKQTATVQITPDVSTELAEGTYMYNKTSCLLYIHVMDDTVGELIAIMMSSP